MHVTRARDPCTSYASENTDYLTTGATINLFTTKMYVQNYLSELRRDFLASIGITYAVFRIAKSRLRGFGEFC